MSKTDDFYSHLANKPYDKPCLTCGATARDAKGHDPCISDLPGVLHACCGHGRGEAYVMFENCMTLHGTLDSPRPQTVELNQQFLDVDDTYTEGVMADGAAILKDGVPLTISNVLDILNGRTAR